MVRARYRPCTMGEPERLSHVQDGADGRPRARMVDVGDKEPSERRSLARARVRFPAGLLGGVLAGRGPKGPIEEVARVAGVLAAKRTAELIPLCHPIALDHVDLEFEQVGDDLLEVRCLARCRRATGVEMEALTGAAVAALTVYDMTKALDPAIAIERVELVEKIGGKRGLWRRSDTAS
jgi:cyclic pyranopterin phosphate synthase